MLIQDIPFNERENLCLILDNSNAWKELAINYIGYEELDLKLAEVKNSNDLLTLWSLQNHSVDELCKLLQRLIVNGKCNINALESIKNSASVDIYNRLMDRIERSKQKQLSPNKSQKLDNTLSKRQIHLNQNLNEDLKNMALNNDNTILSTDCDKIRREKIRKSAGGLLEIDYLELKDATNNWSIELGKGGFGKVYFGEWKQATLAIKCLTFNGNSDNKKDFQIQCDQILNELTYLNCCRNDNILSLYAYSINGAEPCLVYQYMANGSLEKRLNSRKEIPLTSMQRLNIAKGTASGLQFLHTCQNIPKIHGDIKSGNILLDSHLEPKIGDFGLVREGPNDLNESMVVSRIYGTRAYLPEEFIKNKELSTKVDVYSFGIVLFELLTGLRATTLDKDKDGKDHKKEPMNIKDYVFTKMTSQHTIRDLMDKRLQLNEFSIKISKFFLSLGQQCVANDPKLRPNMLEAYSALKNWYSELENLYRHSDLKESD